MGDILSGETQLFILLKDCINFLLHLVLLLWKIHEVLATNNIPHQHCQVQHSRQHHHSHTPSELQLPPRVKKRNILANFSSLSGMFEKRSLFNLLLSIFLYNNLFLWLLIKARGRCDQALCDCFSLSRAVGLDASGLCRPRQNSVIGCSRTPRRPLLPVLQLYTQYKLWARGGCRGASIQGAANCRVSIIPTELSPGAAGCRVNFSPRCWHCHHPPACTFSL